VKKEREKSVLPQPSDTKHQSLGCSEAGTSCGLAHFPVSCGLLQSSYYHQHDTYIPLENRQSTVACLVTRQTKVASLLNKLHTYGYHSAYPMYPDWMYCALTSKEINAP